MHSDWLLPASQVTSLNTVVVGYAMLKLGILIGFYPQVTSLNTSECINSVKHSYTSQKFVHDIVPRARCHKQNKA